MPAARPRQSNLARVTRRVTALFYLLFAAVVIATLSVAIWTGALKYKLGLSGKTPDQVIARLGDPEIDNRKHDQGGTDAKFALGYATWTGERYGITFENGKCTRSTWAASK